MACGGAAVIRLSGLHKSSIKALFESSDREQERRGSISAASGNWHSLVGCEKVSPSSPNRKAIMILVAHSGPESATALDWAARAAIRTRDELTIITVEALPAHLFDPAMAIPDELIKAARERLDEAERHVRDLGVEQVQTVIGYRNAAAAILEASREADLIVVGNRRHGEVASALMGSVAYSVAAHADCPVVLIRGEVKEDIIKGDRVVVGIDGARAGVHAGYFAARVAKTAGSKLTVVAAWDASRFGGFSAEFARRVGIEDLPHKQRDEAQVWVDLAVAKLREAQPDVEIEGKVVQGPAVGVLRQESEGAGLLVVGHRGRGGFTGLLLGSVVHRLLHEPGCPIAVVR